MFDDMDKDTLIKDIDVFHKKIWVLKKTKKLVYLMITN
jgi:hypothetical protein